MTTHTTPMPFALVVEDDEFLSDIFTQAMQGAGYEVESIRDGQVAVDRLPHVTPAVIVLDLHLPHVSGEKILSAIRSNATTRAARVILATADPQFADSLKAEADLVLLKPISFVQLQDLARRLKPGN